MGVFRRGSLRSPHSAKRRAHSVSNLLSPSRRFSLSPRRPQASRSGGSAQRVHPTVMLIYEISLLGRG